MQRRRPKPISLTECTLLTEYPEAEVYNPTWNWNHLLRWHNLSFDSRTIPSGNALSDHRAASCTIQNLSLQQTCRQKQHTPPPSLGCPDCCQTIPNHTTSSGRGRQAKQHTTISREKNCGAFLLTGIALTAPWVEK